MRRTSSDYVRKVQTLMMSRHGITIDYKTTKTIINYFLKNVVVALYNFKPVTINGFFNIRITNYKHKNKDI